MDELTIRLIHLHHCEGVGWSTINHILSKDPNLTRIYRQSFKLSSEINPIFSPDKPTFTPQTIDKILQNYSQFGIKIITIFDQEYPSLLKEIYQPPWVLYLKGDVKLLEREPKLAVVGSRTPTRYGVECIQSLFPELVEKGVLIVSGLANGIDASAHQYAMKLGGKTIGVIAGGFFHLYPKENRKLGLQMMNEQLLLSEYSPFSKPERWQFPARNRIISGLCRGTLLIEAKNRSGSLITANYAVNEGREVFAIPGSIFNPTSVGTNELIQQGAKLVRHARDVLEELYY